MENIYLIIILLGTAGVLLFGVSIFLIEKQNKILHESLRDTQKQNILLENQLKEMFEINNEMRIANENYTREIKSQEYKEFFEREQEGSRGKSRIMQRMFKSR